MNTDPSPAAEPGPLYADVDALLRAWGAERRVAMMSVDRLVRMLRGALFEVVHARVCGEREDAS